MIGFPYTQSEPRGNIMIKTSLHLLTMCTMRKSLFLGRSMGLKRLCCYPSCNRWAEEGGYYCSLHKKEKDKSFQYKDLSKYSPLYRTARWKKVSKQFLRDNPDCVMCGRPATEVHHDYEGKVSYENEEMFFDEAHFVPLCTSCHHKITNQQTQQRKYDSSMKERLWY